MVLSTSYRGNKAAQQPISKNVFARKITKLVIYCNIIVSYKHECLVPVIKPKYFASSDNIQHILKIAIFKKNSLGVGACICAVFLSMCD